MITIRNINEQYGESVSYTAPTLERAIRAMQADVRACGPEWASVTITESDYELIDSPAQAMGRIRSTRKAASSRENGKRGGAPRHWYLISDGAGGWTSLRTTAYGLRRILPAGSTGWEMLHINADDQIVLCVVGDPGDMFALRQDLAIAAGIPSGEIDSLAR